MMNLDQVSRWRDHVGRAGALLCLLFFLSVLDALIAQFRQPVNTLNLLPGASEKINGQLAEEVVLEDLTYKADSEHIHVSLDSVHRGFWLGGFMWRGLVKVDPNIEPGQYTLTVGPKGKLQQAPPLSTFRIRVHPDPYSHRQSHKSLVYRYTGISSMWVIALLIPFIPLALGGTIYLSRRREFLLAQHGMAEIYRVKKDENAYQVAFSLGTNQGVEPGTWLQLLDESGQSLGTIKVLESTETDSVAKVGLEMNVRPGYLVSKN